MTVGDAEEPRTTGVEANGRAGHGLPPEASVMGVAYVADRAAGQAVLLELPPPIGRLALRVDGGDGPGAPAADLSVLTIPVAEHQDESALAAARAWVSPRTPASRSPVQLMTLQGAQVFWCERRVAVVAQPDRVEAVRTAVVEASYYEQELAAVERALAEAWPTLEADVPLAFEFNNRAIGQRPQLLRRFQEVLRIRARLARIGPAVHSPHVHPATLASQVGERFRERTRMVHRHDAVGEQLEVFEKVYESCGQRASDFMLSRYSTTLEWVIIVLLVAQILLNGFEYLTRGTP